jgi:uncharacterized pyridoxamine 5'-phosphate oxidase family protein
MNKKPLAANIATDKLARASWLLTNVKHASMATVNADGTPHNTPFFFMASTDLKKIYWGSHPESEHSKNILRTGQLFVVLYEANISGGLYIRATNGRIAKGNELAYALERGNQLRGKRYDKYPLAREYYEEPNEQRLWVADAQQFWLDGLQKDTNGAIVRDFRCEIERINLI